MLIHFAAVVFDKEKRIEAGFYLVTVTRHSPKGHRVPKMRVCMCQGESVPAYCADTGYIIRNDAREGCTTLNGEKYGFRETRESLLSQIPAMTLGKLLHTSEHHIT